VGAGGEGGPCGVEKRDEEEKETIISKEKVICK
jgi:hypothetical protein